ncbi:MAG: hypothetical protein K6G37_00440 [Bacilli bacterium]|nr:hypothetical protein [Bacilli bacterium]
MYKINYKKNKKVSSGLYTYNDNENVTKIVDTIKEKTSSIESIKISSQDIETMAHSGDFNLVLTYYRQRKRFKAGDKVYVVIPNESFADQCSIMAILKSNWIYDIYDMCKYTVQELETMIREVLSNKDELINKLEVETNPANKIYLKDQIKICNYNLAVLKKGLKDKSGAGFTRKPKVFPNHNN